MESNLSITYVGFPIPYKVWPYTLVANVINVQVEQEMPMASNGNTSFKSCRFEGKLVHEDLRGAG